MSDTEKSLAEIKEKLAKLDGLDQLSYLENLQKLSSLEKLKILDQIETLNDLVKQLDSLKDFNEKNKIDSFLKELSTRVDDFKEQKNLNKLNKLDKLDILNKNKGKLLSINLLTGAIDILKVFVLATLVIGFMIYLPNNFISDNFVKYLHLNKLYNASFVLNSLQNSLEEKEFSTFVDSFKVSMEVQIDDYWQPYSSDSITQKFIKLNNLKRIGAASLPKDLQLHLRRYYQEQKDNTEAYFEEISNIVYLENKDNPQLLSLYKQVNISYFKDSCDTTVLTLKKLKKKRGKTEFIRTAEALTLNCLFQKERIKNIRDVAINFIRK